MSQSKNVRTIQEHVLIDDYLVCIKHNGMYRFYMSDLADWILNYKAYDPSCIEDGELFRNGIHNVFVGDIVNYLNYLSNEEVILTELLAFSESRNLDVSFFIDFDAKQVIYKFDGIEISDYLPSEIWVGKFDLPINFLPLDLQLKLKNEGIS